MEEIKLEPEKKQPEVFFEGFLNLRNSYFSKTKIFASILKERPILYYTKAANVGDESTANNLSPVYLESSLIKQDWTMINLQEVRVEQSKGTKDVFHLYPDNKAPRISFICRSSCSRNQWVTMVNRAKLRQFDEPNYLN